MSNEIKFTAGLPGKELWRLTADGRWFVRGVQVTREEAVRELGKQSVEYEERFVFKHRTLAN